MEKILDLAQLAPDRPEVKFRDGSIFEMRMAEDFSLLDRAAIRKLQLRFEKLQKLEEPTEANIAEMDKALNETIKLVIPDASMEKIEALSERDRIAIIRFFTQQCLASMTEAQQMMNQTGDKLFPVSNVSMAEALKAG